MRLRAWIALPLAALAIATLAGCTAADDTAVETPEPTAAREFVTIPMPNIGPSPAPDPDVDAAIEHTRQMTEDARWASVVALYPDAKRPNVIHDTGYLTEELRQEKLISCLTENGVTPTTGKDASGTMVSVTGNKSTQARAITSFGCETLWAPKPFPFPTEAQRGYIYDYMTQFLVPCFAANGFENPPPPSRADYIRLWPNSGWVVAANGPGGGDEGLTKACPPVE